MPERSTKIKPGVRVGELVVIEMGQRSNRGRIRWICKCDCGSMALSWHSNLIKGRATSCGHGRIEAMRSATVTHGRSRNTPEYSSWYNLIQRCTNPNNPSFKNYGGRGVMVCDEWRSFEAFFSDMGEKPEVDYTIERKNVEKGYNKSNCCWVPRSFQSRNRRNTIKVNLQGQSLCLAEAARLLGVGYGTVRYRIKKGKTPYQALGISE